MSQQEPTLGQVRDELKADLGLDRRVREVEIQQAVTTTALDGLGKKVDSLGGEMRGMKAELLAAIQDVRPKSPWPALSAVVAAIALILLVAERLYG